jgi:hypothetical protein
MESEFNVQIVADAHTPGPSDYSPRFPFSNGPQFSMRSRPPLAIPAPSGGYVTLKSTVGSGAKHTLSSRPPPPKIFLPPGPRYMPPAFGANGRGCGFSRARRAPKVTVTPGPADYKITPSALHAFGQDSPRTAFHNGGRSAVLPASDSPGPAVYSPRFYAKKGSPMWTIKGRHKSP